MLVQLMPRSRVDKHLPHESVLEWVRGQLLREVENSEPAREVVAIGVMLNVGNGSIVSSPDGLAVLHHARLFVVHENVTVWIVEVVRDYSKSVDLEVLQKVLGYLVEQPIHNHTSLNATLGVENQNNPLDTWLVKSLFDQDIAFSNVWCREKKRSLKETLDYIKHNTGAGNG